MENEISYKSFFITYGIFVAVLVVIFGLLIYPIKLGQKKWYNSLKTNVEFVLDEKEPNSWTVENPVKIKNPYALSAACFEARNRKNGEVYKAVILRIQTFYGPIPAVFTIDKDKNVELAGFVSLHGRIANQIKNNTNSKRLEYWKNKIPEIIGEKAGAGE